ncbi:hypothetical protein JXA56_00275 [Candidatus Micrarchaeota archaeon]|nr:hypothetical protein [Candidatus Micrarchaeota archaeon]
MKYNKQMLSPQVRVKRNPVRMRIFKRISAMTEQIAFIADEQGGQSRSVEGSDPQDLASKLAEFQEMNDEELFKRRFRLEWAEKKTLGPPEMAVPHKNLPVNECEKMEFLKKFSSVRRF